MAKECFAIFHKWHVHKTSCIYDIKKDLGLPEGGAEDLRFIYQKVCLKCKMVVDEITPAIDRVKIQAEVYKLKQKSIDELCEEVFGKDR